MVVGLGSTEDGLGVRPRGRGTPHAPRVCGGNHDGLSLWNCVTGEGPEVFQDTGVAHGV